MTQVGDSENPKPTHYHCENDDCSYHLNAVKKGKKSGKARWKILTAFLGPGSFVYRTFCPHCKWELRVNMDLPKKVDEKLPSALDLLRAVPPIGKA